ncbi:MAG: Methyltransferase, FkbM family [Thermoleophilia bacterium]|nr:Methyltransferase, FkbM family [Thermoleophilia bacterium]
MKPLDTHLRGSLGTTFQHGLRRVPTRARGAVVRMILRAVPRGARSSVAGRAAPVLGPDAYLPVLTGALRGANGSVVFDVGANAGFLSLLAARLVGPAGRVIAFEPSPAAVVYLRRHVALNRALNIEIIDVAVADENGRARFSSVGPLELGHLDAEGEVEVETASLDTLVEDRVIPPPDVVKIDVEGAELSVLRGARAIMQANRPVVVLSTHGFDSHEACCSLLRSLGYAVTLLEHSLATTEFDYLGELVAEPTASAAARLAHS